MLLGAGLTDVRTVGRVVSAGFRDAAQFVEFSWAHGRRAVWEAVPERDHPELRRRLIEVAKGFGDRTGAFSPARRVRYTLGRRPLG